MFMEHAENRVIRTSSCIGCDRTTTRERTSLLINLAWPGVKARPPPRCLPSTRLDQLVSPRLSTNCLSSQHLLFFPFLLARSTARCVFVFFQFPITCSLVNIHGQKNIRIFYEYTMCYRKELEISLDSL